MALVETWLPTPAAAPGRSFADTVASWVSTRAVAFVGWVGTLVAVGYVHAVDLAGWPTLANDDEGTYMARAWAVQTGRGAHHSLANYTYWYDHAPFGWMQLVPWTWLTGTYRAGANADIEGRRIMLGYALLAVALVYVVARRAGASRLAALAAMALFGFSPVALDYTRQIFLDTIGMPWALGAFALALSPKRTPWAFAASGACFAAASLSKETYLLFAPALLFLVWQRAAPEARRMCLVAFSSVAFALLALWPIYALLKGELLPGRGHVSLIGAIEWQLAQRKASGSVFTPGSNTRYDVLSWYHDDPWLVGGGVLAMVPSSFFRRLRPLALALFVPVLYALRGGYLPAMYVEGFCPIMALLIACGADGVVRLGVPGGASPGAPRGVREARGLRWARRLGTIAWRGLLLAGLGSLVWQAAPTWAAADRQAMTYKVNTALFQAERFVAAHVPRTASIVVDENAWIDLVDEGFSPSRVVSFWELNTDPDVERRYPRGWRQMDYVLVTNTIRVNIVSGTGSLRPIVEAIAHSTVVRRFGTGTNFVTLYRVHPTGAVEHTWWLPGYGTMRPPASGPAKGERL